MKTIDTKSLLLGILATTLVLTLTSGKMSESNASFQFLATPATIGIYNNSTKTIYLYPFTFAGKGLEETPSRIYKVADDGSSITKK
jgi:hypothetical protein